MDILEAVTERYETLSPAQKRIADYIFKYPDEVCFYSLKEMSEALGVTEVTILRFAKRIGLSSFVELKRQLREHLQVRLSGGDTLGGSPTGSESRRTRPRTGKSCSMSSWKMK